PLRHEVVRHDAADRARAGTQHDALRADDRPLTLHTRHQFAIRDARRDEEGVVAAHELVRLVDVVESEAGVDPALALLVGGGREAPLDEATERLDCGRCCDTLRAAADTDTHVDAAAVAGRVDTTGDVTVEHEAGACTSGTDLLDQLGVAGPVEHRNTEV